MDVEIIPITLSVIIVSWNTCELLKNCLESILANPPAMPVEIWVVDNASADESPQMVRRRFSQVNLLENEVNVGFARANNQALQRCNGKYVLLLNPDTLVDCCSLENLVDFLEENPRAGAAGPMLLNPDGSMQISSHPWPTLTRELLRMFHLDTILPFSEYPSIKWDTDIAQEVDVLKGACLMLRKDVLDQVGHFDEDYFIYSEEVDMCYRIQRAGWQLYWVPEAKVVHYSGQSTRQVSKEMFLFLYYSKIKYFRKHYGSSAAQIYILILMMASLSRILLVPFVLFEKSARRRKHLILVGYYWRLILALLRM
jgi:N-acetylglucosaminyl-diphospho-decaprenol L-rhamnosyltransferase